MDIETRAREVADRVYTAMQQSIIGNADWSTTRNIGGEIIKSALQAVRDETIDEAWLSNNVLRTISNCLDGKAKDLKARKNPNLHVMRSVDNAIAAINAIRSLKERK